MKSAFIYLSVILSVMTVGCQKKPATTNTAGQTLSSSTLSDEDFVPPADSTLTTLQITRWLSCNPALDSLAILYKDSVASPNTATRSIAQENFRRMQNRICEKMGFVGGYAEYSWVITAIKASANTALRDSLGMSTFLAQ